MPTAQELYTTRSAKRLKKEAATVITNIGGLPNGTLINGVANFYTSTKPTTRVDGSALVIGDVWKKANQEFAEWDGTQWVGALKEYLLAVIAAVSSSATTSVNCPFANRKILLRALQITGRVESAPPNPATDYWSFRIDYVAGGGTSSISPTVSVNNQNVAYTGFQNLYLFGSFNQILDFSAVINATGNARGIALIWSKFGSAPSVTPTYVIQYRDIYE